MDSGDPRPAFIFSLCDALGKGGSIVVYNIEARYRSPRTDRCHGSGTEFEPSEQNRAVRLAKGATAKEIIKELGLWAL